MRTGMVWLVALACGCGPEFAVVPQGGLERVVSTVGPVTMTAFANQWDSNPYDLADYLTPIAVELYNAGPYEVRVSYADFALRDDRGMRYNAINPFVPSVVNSRIESSQPSTSPSAHGRLDDLGPLYAARGGGGGGGHSGGGGRGGGYSGGGRSGGHGGVTVGPPSSGRRGGGAWGGVGGLHGGWSGYHIAGGLRGYYGPGWAYWGAPFLYPPYYADYVYFWGPRYYPLEPSAEVIAYSLPEGVLAPGGHVNGFLYFQRATGNGVHALDLSWDAHDARTGAPFGSAHVALEVVAR